MMGRLCEVALLSLVVVFLLNTESTWAKRGSSSSGRKTSSTKTQSKPPSQPANYPRQPQNPNRNSNPYPAGGSYPGAGKPNPAGVPRQNPPNYPGVGSNPNQKPAGGYPAGGNYPGNQNPARGYPNQNPAAGGYPAAGGQYPGRAGNPAGGYPNQQYPAAGGYPVRGGNTGQGYGQPPPYPGGGYGGGGYGGGGYGGGGYGGGYQGGAVGGYTNWNPNNKILSPRYGGGGYGGGYGGGGYGGGGMGGGMGGSPFSRSVSNMGYQPQSSGFAKKAMMAAGVGAVAGMAVGYGLGRFPRPHFNFRNPQEEQQYNNYMYQKYGTKSTDEKDYGRDYEYKLPPRAESYDKFMESCMNKTDLLKDQAGDQDDGDTVGIEEIGYPALVDQMKSRRCVEKYMEYSDRYLQERKRADQRMAENNSSPPSFGMFQLFTSLLMLLSSMLLLQ